MTLQKLATLSVDSNLRPILVVDPGSHLAIGRIIRGLKVARTGLWPKYLGDTDILISASKGKEIEIYKLAATLTAKGYYLQETEQHKNLEQTLAERKAYAAKMQAEMKAKSALAAIPPRGFAAKRFKWSRHRNFIVAQFAQKSAFLAWAKAQNIQPTWTGEHRAIISLAHLPWLQASGIIPMPLALPPATPEPSPEPTPEPEASPKASWTKDRIKRWLNNRGIDTIGVVRKDELLELVNSII